MRHEAEAHSDEDKRRKEVVEARNHADNLAYQAEKMVRDNGDKIDPAKKKEIEDKIAGLRGIMHSDDLEGIQKQIQELEQLIQQAGANMYQQPGAEGAAGTSQPPQDGGQGPNPPGDDVVDGEFKSV
mgnify:CR=1 FL=1